MFELGQTVMTRGIANAMESNPQFREEVTESMDKYVRCDWGNTCEEDAEMNNEAVRNGEDSILASYNTSQGTIWIKTEWDKSVTTVLFPSEY